jgi:predicted SprT family Zn-dependent metalloprotease
MDTIILDSFFESSEIESDYLKSLLEKVLAIINSPELHFGKICEGRIFGTPGAVTWDGEIYLDSKRLQQYDDQIAMAIIAHELAHYQMGHYKDRKGSQEKEIEADHLVKSWGFDVEKFRKEFPINGKET